MVISILGYYSLHLFKDVDLCLTEDPAFQVTAADVNLQSVSSYF